MNLEIPKRRHKHFDLTSLIDIVFNMLLFFILTYQVSKYSEIKVDIPKSIKKNDLSQGVEVTIDSSYRIYVNGIRTDINSMNNILKRFDKRINVILKADKKVELDFLVKVIDVISSAGFESFSILTDYTKSR